MKTYSPEEIALLTDAVTKIAAHLDDLRQNKGYLGRLCFDVGLCNEAYLAIENAERLIKRKSK